MGGAVMIGLGLALAQPKLRVAVITGDGEMLMGMGSLATVGVQRPANLAIVVFDNGLYGETGMQASHTQSGVSLLEVARACGIERVLDVKDEAGLRELSGLIGTSDRTLFARVPILPNDPPRVLPYATVSRSSSACAAPLKRSRRSALTACRRVTMVMMAVIIMMMMLEMRSSCGSRGSSLNTSDLIVTGTVFDGKRMRPRSINRNPTRSHRRWRESRSSRAAPRAGWRRACAPHRRRA